MTTKASKRSFRATRKVKLFSFDYHPSSDVWINVKAKSLTEACERIDKIRLASKKMGVSFCDEYDNCIFKGGKFPYNRKMFVSFECPSCGAEKTWAEISAEELDPCYHECEECGENFHLLTVQDLETYFKIDCEDCKHKIDCLAVPTL